MRVQVYEDEICYVVYDAIHYIYDIWFQTFNTTGQTNENVTLASA